MRGLLVALVLSLSLGCVTLQGETPDQRAYAAIGEYALAVDAAAVYCESPNASLEACRALIAVNNQVDPLIATIRARLDEPSTAERDAALEQATAALLVLIAELYLR